MIDKEVKEQKEVRTMLKKAEATSAALAANASGRKGAFGRLDTRTSTFEVRVTKGSHLGDDGEDALHDHFFRQFAGKIKAYERVGESDNLFAFTFADRRAAEKCMIQ